LRVYSWFNKTNILRVGEPAVSGTVIVVPPDNGYDGFYTLSGIINPGRFLMARASESTCTCESECTGHFPVVDVLAVPHPAFNPDWTYSVQIDLGEGPPDRLAFGIHDCGCFDNSGELTVVIDDLSTDVDGDGIPDSKEDPICLDTPLGHTVNSLGCSLEQICPCARPWGRARWRNHGEYVTCVKRSAQEFFVAGLISKQERLQIRKAARRSECGR